MRKTVPLLLILSLLLGFTACGPSEPETETCTVIFETGDSPHGDIVVSVEKGKTVEGWSIPAPEGYYHDGWFLDGRRWDFDTDIVEKDITLTAGFTPITYVIWFEIDGEPFASQEVAYRQKAIMPEKEPKADDGMRFVCWCYEGAPWDFENSIVTATLHLEAYFEPITETDTNP